MTIGTKWSQEDIPELNQEKTRLKSVLAFNRKPLILVCSRKYSPFEFLKSQLARECTSHLSPEAQKFNPG